MNGLRNMTDDLDKQIQELEEQWNKYHKDHKNNPMPDMMELAKLRIRKKQLEKNANLS